MSEPAQDPQASKAAAVAAIAALLVITDDQQQLTPRVAKILAPLGMHRTAIIEAVKLAVIRPVTLINAKAKHAMAQTRDAEYYYRAAFIVDSANRVTRALREGQTLIPVINSERRNYQRHLDAQGKRSVAASRVNRLVKQYGPVLGWYSVRDNRTSAECAAAHGHNFDVDKRPAIGFPGSVHPECRCKAGPPHRGASTVYSIKIARKSVRAAS